MFKHPENLVESKLISAFEDAIQELELLMAKYGINYCIIGGMAVGHYNHLRATSDLDILVSKKDKEKMASIPIGFLYQVSDTLRRFKLQGTKVPLDVLYSEDFVGEENRGAFKYPEPNTIKSDDNFITLNALIILKIATGLTAKGRLQDFADVQNLIKANNLPRNLIDSFTNLSVVNKFHEIWDDL